LDTKEKGYKGIGMEGFIARSYDRNARRYSAEQYKQWAQKLAGMIQDDRTVLEIAPGPGYLAIELARLRKCRIIGLDISKTFVALSRENAQKAAVDIDFREGNVAAMPFEDETFDLLFCTSAFKNFKEPARAVKEMRRVLKTGGRAWIGDMSHTASDSEIDSYVMNNMKARGLAALFMKLIFKHMLRRRAYTKDQFEEFIAGAHFRRHEINESPLGFDILLER
jgi:ubiquinone/menaquinone biosynthesis C-methylase UbiE